MRDRVQAHLLAMKDEAAGETYNLEQGGWAPQVEFEEGLRDTEEWFRAKWKG